MKLRRALVPTLLFSLAFIAHAETPSTLNLKSGDVVAFVGGTDMVRIQQDGRLEAALSHRFRKATPKFRDLAWDGDTVYFQSSVGERWRRGAFGGWPEQLHKVGATVVIAQFGKIESLDGPGRIDEFADAYGKLLDQLVGDGREIVLIAPSPLDWESSGGENLAEYTEAVETLAKDRGFLFVPGDKDDPVGAFIKGLTGAKEPGGDSFESFRNSVREKHRLWNEYWRPSNWKCLFGDDSRRVFANASGGLPSFQEEWGIYPKLIAAAEERIYNGTDWERPNPPPRHGSEEANTKAELEAFDVLDGFEMNLFADESDGVANPLSVRWDPLGRMYVACSDAYPQIEPGVLPNDKIIRLEDKNGDGRADSSSVFADRLKIPTGMEVGHDIVYVGQGTELLTLRDTTGDGFANDRHLLLSGFGNGDSHQTINSFVWSPGGELWFCQGDGIESRVETPFGISSLYQAGVFRLRPGELRLDGLLDDFMGPGNPWGVAFDDFGQSFVIDGAGGISYLTPASIPAKRRLKLPRIGNPGGYCGIECLGASSIPEEMQGEFVIGDYKKNQVSRFAVSEDGAGFKVEWREPLLRSRHRNFRPIDVKTGPDGAIYIVDWYNPITCHQDDFYRHPDRDKKHGRIWRVAPKGGSLKPQQLASSSTAGLLAALQSPERWTRQKAKQVLASKDPEEVVSLVRKSLHSKSKTKDALYLIELISLLERLDVADRSAVVHLMESSDHRARAYGARVIGRWGHRIENVFDLLKEAAEDSHPLVRMEAVLACGSIPDPASVLIAAAVAELPRDRWIDYAFSQAVHHLEPHWLPAFKRGELDFGSHRRGLAAVLGQADSKSLLSEIRKLLNVGELDVATRDAMTQSLIALGEKDGLRYALEAEPPSPSLLRTAATVGKPDFEFVGPLRKILNGDDLEARAAAMEVVGNWRVTAFLQQAHALAQDRRIERILRLNSIDALGMFGDKESIRVLEKIAGHDAGSERIPAVIALLGPAPQQSAKIAAKLLGQRLSENEIRNLLSAFSKRSGAGKLLAHELGKLSLSQELGEKLQRMWIGSGNVDSAMTERLNELAGVKNSVVEFSDELVRTLVETGHRGDRKRGEALFRSERTGCAACHKVGGGGGVIGPDLSAVGSGIPPDRIVIEVLWPKLQAKEGYSLTLVTMRDGRVIQGYEQANRDKSLLLLRDYAESTLHHLKRTQIAKVESIGSLMPPTAQALSREELGDLLSYLFNLGITDSKER